MCCAACTANIASQRSCDAADFESATDATIAAATRARHRSDARADGTHTAGGHVRRAGGAFVRFVGAFLVGLWVPVEYIVLYVVCLLAVRILISVEWKEFWKTIKWRIL